MIQQKENPFMVTLIPLFLVPIHLPLVHTPRKDLVFSSWQGLTLPRQAFLPLETLLWPLFVMAFFRDRVSRTIYWGLTSNHDPPDLCFLSSQDYRCEPLALSMLFLFCFVLRFLGLNSGPTPWGTSPDPFFFVMGFFEIGSRELFAQAGFKQ
jgi:hypothetical protein